MNHDARKGSTLIILLCVLVVVVIAAAAVWYFKQNHTNSVGNYDNLPSSKVEIAGWKTYTDQQHGFSFEYPNDWVVSSSVNMITINSNKVPSDTATILFDSNPKQLIARDYYDGSDGPAFFGCLFCQPPPVSIKIGGVSAYAVNQEAASLDPFAGDASSSDIIIPRTGYFIRIIISNHDSVFNQILSTFQFASSSLTAYLSSSIQSASPAATSTVSSTEVMANWQTYTNQQYGFSIRYPSFMQDVTANPPIFFCSSITCLEYPPERLSDYVDFAGGFMGVNMPNATSSEVCDTFSDEGWTDALATSSINGVTFYSVGDGESYTQHSVEWHEYRTYHNGACYSITAGTETVTCQTNETYDSSSATTYCDGKPELNGHEDIVDSILSQVVLTFQFIK